MTRVKTFQRPEDFAAINDVQTQREAAALFDELFPGQTAPAIDDSHLGIAIAAHNPKLALHLARLSRLMALELSWCQRTELRELAIQTVNHYFGCDYAFSAKIDGAAAAGLSREQQSALGQWQSSPLFNDEQRLVIAYSQAVASGKVPDELFAAVVEQYGEKGAVEFTAVVGFWAFWAMLLNATGAKAATKDVL